MAIPAPGPLFPTGEEFSRALFTEGLRHLEDARVLHTAERYPASIASSAKAAELAVKTVLVLDGAIGWWNSTLATHAPLTEIEHHLFLKRHFVRIQSYRGTLPADVKLLESLTPTRSAAKGSGIQFNQQEENPEYPFLFFATGADTIQVRQPAAHFNEVDSLKHFRTAHDIVTAISTEYLPVRAWGLTLPLAI